MTNIEFSQKTERSTDEYRKKFIRLVIQQEREIDDALETLYEDVASVVVRNNRIVTDEDRVQKELPPLFEAYAVTLMAIMLAYNQKATEVLGDREQALIASTYERADFNRLMRQSSRDLTASIANLPARRFAPGEDPVGLRIKTIADSGLKTVRNIISVGIDEGQSAKQIADAITNYIVKENPESFISPWQYYRDRFGYKVKKVPKGIMPGSLQYNSVRIARTEINMSWRNGTVKLHDGSKWIKGYWWRLSPSHPEPDDCDTWADGGPYDSGEIGSFGHPHCMCFVEAALKEESEL